MIKLYFRALFGWVSSEEFKELVSVLDYRAVASVLRARRSYVSTVYWHSDWSSDGPATVQYTVIEIVEDEPMRRLLLHFGAKTYSELLKEEKERRERLYKKKQEEKAARKERGEEIVSKLIG